MDKQGILIKIDRQEAIVKGYKAQINDLQNRIRELEKDICIAESERDSLLKDLFISEIKTNTTGIAKFVDAVNRGKYDTNKYAFRLNFNLGEIKIMGKGRYSVITDVVFCKIYKKEMRIVKCWAREITTKVPDGQFWGWPWADIADHKMLWKFDYNAFKRAFDSFRE